MPIAYFVRGGGASWAVIKLYPDNREEIVADELSKEAAIERCAELLEKIPRCAAAAGELPLAADIAPRRQRARQFRFKF